MVKEIYVCDGTIKDSKYVLMIDDNDNVSLTFYLRETKIPEYKPVLIRFMSGIRIEYGVPNCMGTRSCMSFIDYETGELRKNWTKIK